jgi:3-methyladenine DNA glycosylase/8-oxoguanine DNA glycosylase
VVGGGKLTAVGKLALTGPAGEPVDLRRVLVSHGVAELAPNHVDLERYVLETTTEVNGRAQTIRVFEVEPGFAQVEVSGPARGASAGQRALALARHLLRLDEDLSAFYERAAKDPALSWVTSGAGRMLPSATVFEDVVKTICTTNTSWSATVRMTNAIVEGLGATAPDGRHAFPSPAAMAAAPGDFYERVARTGYRGAYIRRLASDVAGGSLDLEALADPAISDDEVEKSLLALPGVGPYAAAHVMLTSLGRYGRLILDSWTRPTYAKLTGRRAADDAIERRFRRRYGPYAGLAFWLMLTRDWVAE